MLKTVSSFVNVIGALNYKGTWNASTNTPALASGVGTKGDYYVVSVAGSTNLDGVTLWGVGDWAVFNGTAWQKVDGGDTGNFTTVNASSTITGASLIPSGASIPTNGMFLPAANTVGFATNSAEVARLSSGGNLGVGTTSPSYIISMGGNAGRTIGMERITTAASPGQNLTILAGGATVGSTDQNGGRLDLSSGTSTGTGSSPIRFLTATAGTTGTADNAPTEKMRINANGNVGIGSTNPQRLFVIDGGASGPVLQITNNTAGNASGNGLEIICDGTNTFFVNRENGYSAFNTNNVERVRITATGNIHTPAGATNMTAGFFYIPAADGVPSGTPTSISGTVPMYYDTTNNDFYIYNGAWKKVALA